MKSDFLSEDGLLPSNYKPNIQKVQTFVMGRGELLFMLAQELAIRGFSRRTIKSYLDLNKRFLLFLNKSAKEATAQDIKSFLLFLKAKGNGNTSLNLAISALKFYFEQILKRKLFFSIRRPKKEKFLPTVLSKQEIVSLIEATDNLKHKLLLSIMYGSGLRVSEVVSLKIQHLDLNGLKVLVKAGKGAKDRYSLLSKHSAELARQYMPQLPAEQNYLFSGAGGRGRLTSRSAQNIFDQALNKAGINKKAGCHSLRHSFATHLLLNGVDILLIQKLLGHQSIKTTQGYLQVAESFGLGIKSPLDV